MPDNKKEEPASKVSIKTTKSGASLLPEIQKQFDFLQSYVNSPKYKERLGKMINTEKSLQQTATPQPFASEVLLPYKTNVPTGQVVQGVTSNLNQNLANLANNKIEVGNFNLGTNIAGGYDSAYKDIRLREDLLKQNPTVPVHELSHGALGGSQPYSPAYARQILSKIFIPPTNSKFEGEVQKPTEVKARLDAVRYLGSKHGLIDPGKTDFTIEDFRKLKQNKDIRNDFNFKQLLDQLPKGKEESGMVWLMNNIAKTKDQINPNEGLVV